MSKRLFSSAFPESIIEKLGEKILRIASDNDELKTRLKKLEAFQAKSLHGKQDELFKNLNEKDLNSLNQNSLQANKTAKFQCHELIKDEDNLHLKILSETKSLKQEFECSEQIKDEDTISVDILDESYSLQSYYQHNDESILQRTVVISKPYRESEDQINLKTDLESGSGRLDDSLYSSDSEGSSDSLSPNQSNQSDLSIDNEKDQNFQLKQIIQMLPLSIKNKFTQAQLLFIIDPKTSMKTRDLQAGLYNKQQLFQSGTQLTGEILTKIYSQVARITLNYQQKFLNEKLIDDSDFEIKEPKCFDMGHYQASSDYEQMSIINSRIGRSFKKLSVRQIQFMISAETQQNIMNMTDKGKLKYFQKQEITKNTDININNLRKLYKLFK